MLCLKYLWKTATFCLTQCPTFNFAVEPHHGGRTHTFLSLAVTNSLKLHYCLDNELFYRDLRHPISIYVVGASDALCIRTPLGSIPEPLISGKCFYSVYIGKLINRRLAYVCFHEGDIEHHHGVEGIRGKLKRRNTEVGE